MSWKNLLSFAVVSVLLAGTAVADPTASLSGVANGGNFDWTLSFAPDETLFSTTNLGNGGSLATAFQIEVAAGSLVSVGSPTADFTGGTNPIIDSNPGADPYAAGATSEGIKQYANTTSDLATGMVDALFIPLGSTFFTTGGDKTALTFTTSSNSAMFGGIVAQAGTEYTLAVDTSMVDVGPTLPGDYNGSGLVEAGDLNLVLDNWGTNTPPIPAGWVNDLPEGLIEATELNNVLDNWGNSVGAGAVSAVVPEPASVALLALAAFGMVGYYRSK